MGSQSPLYNREQFYQLPKAVAAEPQHTERREFPKIDGNDVVGSLNGMLGPSPDERADEEQRLEEHRRKMHGWTALFNGLRHLANLYYATKGAPGQKLSDPHQQIEQQYQAERKRLSDIHAADRNYYANLYNLRRQMEADKRTGEEHQAKLDWYKNRDEMARQKAELDKLKSVRVIKHKDGSMWKYDPATNEFEMLLEHDPLYVDYMQSQIDRNNRMGTGGSGGHNQKKNGNPSGSGLGWGKNNDNQTDW